MLTKYEYLYYKLYKGFLKAYGRGNNPKLTAWLALSQVIFVNIASIFLIFDNFFDLNRYLGDYFFEKYSKEQQYLYTIPYLLFFYFTLGFRANKIIDRFKVESKEQAERGKVQVRIYVIGSFVFFILTIIFRVFCC